MTTRGFKFRRDVRALHRRFREWRMIAKGLSSTDHPVMAHIIPIRRCNLSCTYCNEYDTFSKPVPAEVMTERLDRLAAFGTTIITFSGGEPTLRKDLPEMVASAYRHCRPGIINIPTNGIQYKTIPRRIERVLEAAPKSEVIALPRTGTGS